MRGVDGFADRDGMGADRYVQRGEHTVRTAVSISVHHAGDHIADHHTCSRDQRCTRCEVGELILNANLNGTSTSWDQGAHARCVDLSKDRSGVAVVAC